MLGFLMLTLNHSDGPQRVIVFICLTISNDIGGYAAGVMFGKHPIAPGVSPKKSWEGLRVRCSCRPSSAVGCLCGSLTASGGKA